jgi:hypothetical protein
MTHATRFDFQRSRNHNELEAVLPSDDELGVGKGKLRTSQFQVRKPVGGGIAP